MPHVVNAGGGMTKPQQESSTHLTKQLSSQSTLFGLHTKEVSKFLTQGVVCSHTGQNVTENRLEQNQTGFLDTNL